MEKIRVIFKEVQYSGQYIVPIDIICFSRSLDDFDRGTKVIKKIVDMVFEYDGSCQHGPRDGFYATFYSRERAELFKMTAELEEDWEGA